MKKFVLLLFFVVFAMCNKEDKPIYPDCFSDVESTHQSQNVCGDFSFDIPMSEKVILSIYIGEAKLGLNQFCQSFSKESHGDDIHATLYRHVDHPDSIYFRTSCPDALIPTTGYQEQWRAISGEVVVAVSKEYDKRKEGDEYLFSVEVDNMVFRHTQTKEDTLIQPIIIVNRRVHTGIKW